jgi:hypothetical protein
MYTTDKGQGGILVEVTGTGAEDIREKAYSLGCKYFDFNPGTGTRLVVDPFTAHPDANGVVSPTWTAEVHVWQEPVPQERTIEFTPGGIRVLEPEEQPLPDVPKDIARIALDVLTRDGVRLRTCRDVEESIIATRVRSYLLAIGYPVG